MNPSLLHQMRATGGVLYLGSPFTGYRGELDEAARRASYASGELHALGIVHFCPISHGYMAAEARGLDHRDHGFWMPHCIAHLTRCSGLVVLMLPGWETSIGLSEERRIAEDRNLPIMFMSPPDA